MRLVRVGMLLVGLSIGIQPFYLAVAWNSPLGNFLYFARLELMLAGVCLVIARPRHMPSSWTNRLTLICLAVLCCANSIALRVLYLKMFPQLAGGAPGPPPVGTPLFMWYSWLAFLNTIIYAALYLIFYLWIWRILRSIGRTRWTTPTLCVAISMSAMSILPYSQIFLFRYINSRANFSMMLLWISYLRMSTHACAAALLIFLYFALAPRAE
jgi:hypothetical protein